MYKKKSLHQIYGKGSPMQKYVINWKILRDKEQLKWESIQRVDQLIIRSSQTRYFSDESEALEMEKSLKKSRSIYTFQQYLQGTSIHWQK